ncbi:hypothetical protein LCGC14_2142110 [marine sediment metagenome]|uniref:Uncharacterized protein n=1 Tax=marine sediment metagenome TaxID=412755 RepID=A0A0F9DY13_9ZZZZ
MFNVTKFKIDMFNETYINILVFDKKWVKIENDIKAKLSEDKQLNIATLTKLLREQLKSE